MSQQDDNYSSASEDEIKDKEDWLNEHGNPSNKFLQDLADRGNIEKLRVIAEDLDAEFNSNDSADDLVGVIRAATRDNPNTTT